MRETHTLGHANMINYEKFTGWKIVYRLEENIFFISLSVVTATTRLGEVHL